MIADARKAFSTTRIGVVHTVAALNEAFGGPSRSVVSLCRALAQIDTDVSLVSTDFGAKYGQLLGSPTNDTMRMLIVQRRFGAFGEPAAMMGLSRAVTASLADMGVRIVNDHGAWRPSNAVAAWAASRGKAALVLHPRGMLMSWSLRHHRLRKLAAMGTYQGWALRRADLIVATSADEARETRAGGVSAPVAVIPNGIGFPTTEVKRGSEGAERCALFLSRIHRKKGILDLVEAWIVVRPSGWRLAIAGPDEEGTLVDLARKVREAGMESRIRFLGSIPDAQKWDLYRSADLFVLPSYSENFGIVVGEALASGVPVITTDATPWKELQSIGAGWTIPCNRDALVEALKVATSLSPEVLRSMGTRGEAFVRDQFSWVAVARRTDACYRWLLGMGPRPRYVFPADAEIPEHRDVADWR